MGFFVALRKELLEQWRSYRLLVVVIVFTVFGLLSPLIARFMVEFFKLLPNGEQIAQIIPPPTVADAITQYLKNLSQSGVILALLLTMGAVAQEKDKGTAAMMLVKPLARGAFLGAKFAALSLTFALSIVLAGAGAYYYTLLLFQPLPLGGWLALNGLLLLFILVYVAVTLLCSTIARSPVVAAGLAVALVALLGAVGALPGVGEYLPGRLLTWGAAVAGGGAGTGWPAAGVSLGIVVTALVGAWLLFERQEL
ncbi:MAG: hypothetical protein AUK03_09075 [Anaerolineae bacterium CG2_30_64_16]|nr:MAG: hypothetical protein AUK03_09075 [Anaerolineae bacterium CG2_30_64_16]